MEKIKLRSTTYFKIKAFIWDFYSKSQNDVKFNLKNLIEYHKVSNNIAKAMSHKYDLVKLPLKSNVSKYKWIGYPPTDDDIVEISNNLYNICKTYNQKESTIKKIEFNENPELSMDQIESLKNQLSILQEMFSNLKK